MLPALGFGFEASDLDALGHSYFDSNYSSKCVAEYIVAKSDLLVVIVVEPNSYRPIRSGRARDRDSGERLFWSSASPATFWLKPLLETFAKQELW